MQKFGYLKGVASDYLFGTEVKKLYDELNGTYRAYHQKGLEGILPNEQIEEEIKDMESIWKRKKSFFINTHKDMFNIADLGIIITSIISQDTKWLVEGISAIEIVRAYFAYNSRDLKDHLRKSIKLFSYN